MKTLLEIWRVLSPPQRRRLLILRLVSLILALSTLYGIAAVLQRLIASILIVGSLITLDPLVACLAVTPFGAGYLFMYAVTRSRLLRNGEIESLQAAERTRTVDDALGSIRGVILLDAQTQFIERFRRSCEALARTLTGTLASLQSSRDLLGSVGSAHRPHRRLPASRHALIR